MPRNSSGNFTLVSGNPVVSDTVIETQWANPTLADIAAELTNSLDRNGRGGMLAPFKVADGTAQAPGLAFTAQSNTGIYRDTTSVVGISANGSSVAKLSDIWITLQRPTTVQGNANVVGTLAVAAPLLASDGNAAAPSLSFSNDSDTGFFSPAPGVIALTVNGVEVQRWTSAGPSTGGVPVGTVIDFAGPTVPTGYLVCDGSAVSRTVYANLFAAIGTAWGAPDGNTFNLPNLQRRVTIGAGGTVVVAPNNSVGNVGGGETITLAYGHMPIHNHGVTDTGHIHGLTDPGHTHSYINPQLPSAGSNSYQNGPQNSTWRIEGIAQDVTGSKTTGIAVQSAATGIQTQNAGGNAPFGLMQPSAVVNKCIKY